ncbi:exopolysaccharide biosynthesis GT4 family glycosyltransferase EpsE [Thioclava kandeliae]|uniref:Exopolysaccharide biosynthesis GT4 family glycosyltransferase EpsE n=1 Tax=Thioclava kandeliae TaxID=3070818 RepID=A0ABV1SLT3_9RHOB
MGDISSDGNAIAVLAAEYPMPTHTFIRREIEALRKLGADVHVFSTREPASGKLARGWGEQARSQCTYLVPFDVRSLWAMPLTLLRAPIYELVSQAAREGKASLRDAIICLPAAARLAAECKRRKIAHIHAHFASRSALVAALAARMSGLPYSITHHGALKDFGGNQTIKWSQAKFAMVITQELLDELEAALAPTRLRASVVQPMGVDSEWFQRKTSYKPRQVGETLRVFSCGRLTRIKGHDCLIEAVALRVGAGDDIQLEIAGGGSSDQDRERLRLLELSEKLGIKDRVSFLGAISEEDVRAKLQASHVFALASRYEAFGVAYIEAMSCGVPTIGTRVGGVPEIIIDGECGFLVPPEAPADLAQAIGKIGDNPVMAELLSSAGRQRVMTRFPIDASARKLLAYSFPDIKTKQ